MLAVGLFDLIAPHTYTIKSQYREESAAGPGDMVYSTPGINPSSRVDLAAVAYLG